MRTSASRLGATALIVPGVATLLLAGCKAGQGTARVQPSGAASGSAASTAPGSPAAGPTNPGAPTSSAPTRLTITVRASEKAQPRTWTLTCDPVGGDLPRAKEACALLARDAAAGKNPFAPVPKDRMCTQIYGGPQVATVTGIWNGKKIDARFDRKNGCEIKRWGDLAPLFGPLPTPH